MKHKPFAPRKRFLPALIAFVCTHWNHPELLYSVTFPPIVKGTDNGNKS